MPETARNSLGSEWRDGGKKSWEIREQVAFGCGACKGPCVRVLFFTPLPWAVFLLLSVYVFVVASCCGGVVGWGGVWQRPVSAPASLDMFAAKMYVLGFRAPPNLPANESMALSSMVKHSHLIPALQRQCTFQSFWVVCVQSICAQYLASTVSCVRPRQSAPFCRRKTQGFWAWPLPWRHDGATVCFRRIRTRMIWMIRDGRFPGLRSGMNLLSTGEDWCFLDNEACSRFFCVRNGTFVVNIAIQIVLSNCSLSAESSACNRSNPEVGCEPTFLLPRRCEAPLENYGAVQNEPLPLAPHGWSRLALSGSQVSKSHSFGSLPAGLPSGPHPSDRQYALQPLLYWARDWRRHFLCRIPVYSGTVETKLARSRRNMQ